MRIQGPKLQERFLNLLGQLSPSPAVLGLFNEIVRALWVEREKVALQGLAAAEFRISELQRRLDVLEETFVFSKSIDHQSYISLRDKLRDEIIEAELTLEQSRCADLDIEIALAGSDRVLRDSAGLWRSGNLDQRRRLQTAVFPEGVSFDGEEFGTAVTSPIFKGLAELSVASSSVASPTGFEPVF